MIAGALGIARAQNTVGPGSPSNHASELSGDVLYGDGTRNGTFRNGECPVCHTMASPYKDGNVFDVTVRSDKNWNIAYLHQDAKVVRCKACNCAFWQDATE